MSLLDPVIKEHENKLEEFKARGAVDRYDPSKCYGFCSDSFEDGFPLKFKEGRSGSCLADTWAGAYLGYLKELKHYRDLFNGFRQEVGEYLKEGAILTAEQFYLDSVYSGWWSIPSRKLGDNYR